MNRRCIRFLVTFLLSAGSCFAISTTVSLTLEPGWNSIWLDVAPVYSSGADVGEPMTVEDVFTDAAITFVATPTLSAGTAEFVSDANELEYNQDSWKVWRSSSELGENSLITISGHQAYLVKVDGASSVVVSVTGEAEFSLPDWRAKQYQLVGFGLTDSPPFDEFFSVASDVHPVSKIFEMDASGNWVGVNGSDLMQSHQAYWIYSEGSSDFTGSVKIDFNNIDGLNFGDDVADVEVADPDGGIGSVFVNLEELVFSNISSDFQDVEIEKVDPATSGGAAAADELRVYLMEPGEELLDYDIGNQLIGETVASIASGGTNVVTLGAHRNWTSGESERENLYRIVVGSQYFWLPIRSMNPDLSDASSGSADAAYQGLWVGTAVIDEVSGVNAPTDIQGTTSRAPVRVILHVDASGAVSVLPHVMVMQKKRASDLVEPEFVLVVDESKIPFFEGIEERNGKSVGMRIESVGYDMPRKLDVLTQVELLDDIVAFSEADGLNHTDDVVDSDVEAYVNVLSSRPPELVEDYYDSWALSGGMGPDQIIGTSVSSPLSLDPFHRANPYRHAFHRDHVAGFTIERAWEIVFGGEQTEGALTGIFTETLSGLAAFDIVAQGSIKLERISEIGELH